MGGLAAGMSVPATASVLQASPANSHPVTLLPGLTDNASSPEVVREAGETRPGPIGRALTTAQTDKLVEEVLARHTQSFEALDAFEDLNHGLLLARENGEQVPCLGPGADAWTSDDATDQELAADLCLLCPVFTLCQRYADVANPRAGTWAGVTRQPSVKERRYSRIAEANERRLSKSSPGRSDRAEYRVYSGEGCRCSCGGTPRTSVYLPGHDTRHLSALLAGVRDGSLSTNSALGELAHSERLQAKLLTWLGR